MIADNAEVLRRHARAPRKHAKQVFAQAVGVLGLAVDYVIWET
jgi:hypothetical protein